ncbi:MAG: translation initiation factor IF-3, partial [Clostridiales bacterium]|nr:translation initiation factor IF-3 [Clostridiales bacterium]
MLCPLFLFTGRCETIKKENLINEEIREKEVRVIDSDGTQLGIMSIEDALKLSIERKLDLVNIAPNAKPPVCKILDYGKFRYDQQKKEKEARKKQKVIDVKEI